MILDRIKTILMIWMTCFYVYKYFGTDYDTVPLSVVEKSLRNNSTMYSAIYIDEPHHTAYLRLNSTYDDKIYMTSFSNHQDFKGTVMNLTGPHYEKMSISYNTNATTFGDLIYNITFGIIGITLIFSVLKLIFGGSAKNSLGSGEDDSSDLLGSVFPQSNSGNYFSVVKNSKVKFTDVIGLKNVKEDLQEFVRYLKYNKEYKATGCELPRGLLFVGPPGVGKTFIAKAFAGEANANFIATSGSSFNEIFVGVGSKRVRELFRYARQHAPCVIFLDEIDAIGSRSVSFDRNELNRTVNALLSELDGMNDTSGIMVIAATNLPELLDPALTRSGRFDKKIVFDHPNLDERVELLKMYLGKIKLDESFNMETDTKFLAQRMARLTGADIKNVCNQAIITHMKTYTIKEVGGKKKHALLENSTGKTGATLKDLTDSIDDVCIGIVKRERAMSEKEKVQVAYHEAGHTLVGCLIEHGSVPLKVSMIPRGHSLGFTQPEATDKYLMFRKELIATILVTFGGRAAELVKFNDITTGASDDLRKISEMMHKFLTEHCFGETMYLTVDKLHSDEYKTRLNDHMTKLLNQYFDFTCEMLRKEKDLLEAIAKKLQEKETLSRDDLLEIIPKDKIGSVKNDF